MMKAMVCVLSMLALGAYGAEGVPAKGEAQKKEAVKPVQPVRKAAEVNVTKIAKTKRALVLELLRVVHANQQAQEILDTMIVMLPTDVKGVLRESLDAEEMVRKVIPVYEKHLTIEDLEGILAFYRTPTGQNLLKAQPKITKDSMIVMKVYAQRKLAQTLNAEKEM